MLGVTPVYVSRLLKEMESDGLIRRKDDWLFVLDLKNLALEN